MMKILGDYRWTADMILATWKMAETGEVPAEEYGFEYRDAATPAADSTAAVQVPGEAAGRACRRTRSTRASS